MARLLTLALAACLALGAAGCGDSGSGAPTKLIVTTDFGNETVDSASVNWSDGLTAMRQVQRQFKTETQYGGKYISKIGELAEGGQDSWLFMVDGVESTTGASGVRLKQGAIVQWDLHNWQSVRTGGAIVGAFPRPLDQLGANVVCRDVEANCQLVETHLKDAGVTVSEAGRASVVVGPWSQISDVEGVRDLETDAATNGAFASFSDDGRTITPARSDGSSGPPDTDAGLLAAFAEGEAVTWVVTGTDSGAVELATDLIAPDHEAITNHFAVLAARRGPQALPLAAPGD